MIRTVVAHVCVRRTLLQLPGVSACPTVDYQQCWGEHGTGLLQFIPTTGTTKPNPSNTTHNTCPSNKIKQNSTLMGCQKKLQQLEQILTNHNIHIALIQETKLRQRHHIPVSWILNTQDTTEHARRWWPHHPRSQTLPLHKHNFRDSSLITIWPDSNNRTPIHHYHYPQATR